MHKGAAATRVAAVVMAVLTLAGCAGRATGANDAARDGAGTLPPAVPAVVTVPPTSVTVPATTAAAAPAPVTAPATPPPVAAPEAELRAALLATHEAAWACLERPVACDPATVAVPGSPAFELFSGLVGRYREQGYEVRHLPEVTAPQIESVEVGPSAGTGTVTICDIDGDRVVEPAVYRGSAVEIVVNDEVVARRVVVHLQRTADGWRRAAVELLGTWPLGGACR